jgi:3-hydroxyacyl-[acyl-carrier-protein] dehydratase
MTTLLVSTQHPAFSGHFPDAPLLPGVVLLDEMLRSVEDAGLGNGWSIATAKFLQPVRPGETLTFEHEPLANGALRFAIRSGGRPVATGDRGPPAPSGRAVPSAAA